MPVSIAVLPNLNAQPEQQFLDMVETAPMMVWCADAAKQYYYFNRRWLNFTGLSLSRASGSKWIQAIHPEDQERCTTIIANAYSLKKPFQLDYRLRHYSGEFCWVMDTGTPRYSTAGSLVGFFGSCLEIEDRKHWEQALRNSEERFRILVENTSDVITVYSSDLSVIYQSPTIQRVLGYKVHERFGKNLYHDSLTHPEDRAKEVQLLERALAEPGVLLSEQLRILHQDGSTRYMDVLAKNLLDTPSVKGIAVHYKDISASTIAAQHKDEFLGVVSHELRTPVTSLKAYAQVLERRFLLEGENSAAKHIKKMDAQIDRLSILINDLLDVTKIEAGKLALRPERFNLNELVEEVIEQMQLTTAHHRIYFREPQTAVVQADRDRIGQVLTNLLSNAIKYSPSTTDITVRLTLSQEKVTISVQDHGIGIPKALQEKLFQRFYRIKTSQSNTISGLGLGLFISAEIIRRHKGEMYLESEEGNGSTFSFALPLVKNVHN